MRRLRTPIGAIPRAFKDHRRPDAKRYRAYCLAIQEQWGPLPAIALPTLREAGRIAVELERLGADLELARARKQRREAARIGKRQFMAREQLGRLERRLEELAPPRSHSFAAAVRAGGHR
jgi:hypothetical protein